MFPNRANDAVIDQLVMALVIGRLNRPHDYVAHRVLPAKDVCKAGYLQRLAAGAGTDTPSDADAYRHTDGADVKLAPNIGFDPLRYVTVRHALREILSDGAAKDTRPWRGAPANSEQAAVRRAVAQRMFLETWQKIELLRRLREMRFGTFFGTVANWHADSIELDASEYFDVAGVNPIEYFQEAAEATGGETCILSNDLWLKLQLNEPFLKALSVTTDSSALSIPLLTTKLARFGIKQIIVPKAETTDSGGLNRRKIVSGFMWIGKLGFVGQMNQAGEAVLDQHGNPVMVYSPETLEHQLTIGQDGSTESTVTVSGVAAMRMVHREEGTDDAVPVPVDYLDGFRIERGRVLSKLSNEAVISHQEVELIADSTAGFVVREAA